MDGKAQLTTLATEGGGGGLQILTRGHEMRSDCGNDHRHGHVTTVDWMTRPSIYLIYDGQSREARYASRKQAEEATTGEKDNSTSPGLNSVQWRGVRHRQSFRPVTVFRSGPSFTSLCMTRCR